MSPLDRFRSRRASWIRPALVLTGALLAGGALLLGSGGRRVEAETPSPPTARPALTVTTVTPTRGPLEMQLPANGNIAAWQEASIGAEGSGLRIAKVLVNVGDQVRAGQVLATFAAETVQAEVAQARASLLEAQAQAAEAQANAERAQTLTASGALSRQQIQQYATAAQTAQARVEAAKALLQAQQVRMQRTQVRAPDAGVISARQATVGAVVAPGAELFRMVRQGRLEWRAEVPSNALPRIRPGMKARLTTPAQTTVEGTVRVVAPTVDPQTRNALVYVDLPAHPDLRAGLFAQGSFLLGARDALQVPMSALVIRDGFSHVLVVGNDQRVRLQRVETGLRQGDRVEILSGLDAQATVVERGGAFLHDGDLVRVQPAARPATPGATS